MFFEKSKRNKDIELISSINFIISSIVVKAFE